MVNLAEFDRFGRKMSAAVPEMLICQLSERLCRLPTCGANGNFIRLLQVLIACLV